MKLTALVLSMAALAAGLNARTISPAELESWLAGESPPILIDIRSGRDYAQSHLPGALHMPANSLERRTLPPLGRVVLYGSGLGRYDEAGALDALAKKPGIEPFLLKGGFAAWAAGSRPVAGQTGLIPETLPALTYAEAISTLPPDAVILDTRPIEPPAPGTLSPQSTAPDLVADWAQSLGRPLRRSATSPAANSDGLNPVGALAQTDPADELLVIVDDDPVRAERAARRLRAQGHTRVVVLVGGVEVILFQGQYGRERQGTATTMEGPTDELDF